MPNLSWSLFRCHIGHFDEDTLDILTKEKWRTSVKMTNYSNEGSRFEENLLANEFSFLFVNFVKNSTFNGFRILVVVNAWLILLFPLMEEFASSIPTKVISLTRVIVFLMIWLPSMKIWPEFSTFETACCNVLQSEEDFPQVLASTPLFSLTWNGWNVVLYFQRFRPKIQL